MGKGTSPLEKFFEEHTNQLTHSKNTYIFIQNLKDKLRDSLWEV